METKGRKRPAEPDGDEIIVRPLKMNKRNSLQMGTTRQSASRVTKTQSGTPRGSVPPKKNARKMQTSNGQSTAMTITEGSEGEESKEKSRKQKSRKRYIESDDEVQTPRHKYARKDVLPSPADTPSRGATKLFDKLQLSSAITPKSTIYRAYQTPPSSPEALGDAFVDVLPSEVSALVRMFSAIANATSAQLACNVSEQRINVKELLSVATRAWTKRDLLLNDLIKVLPTARTIGFDFTLEDFGRAGIFMVRDGLKGNQRSTMIPDTTRLCTDFESALRREWQASAASSMSAEVFVDTLPLLEIRVNDSVQKASSLLTRGKERLTALKASQSLAHDAQNQSTSMIPRAAESIQDRGSSLLDRIRTKEILLAARPAGPSQEELERRAALCRVEAVARVLEVLSAGRPRASFSMQAVVQHVQQSLRSPMSKEEVNKCLKIMADEIMPSFVNVIDNGTISGVVVTRSGKLGIADLKKRLADADS